MTAAKYREIAASATGQARDVQGHIRVSPPRMAFSWGYGKANFTNLRFPKVLS